mgnify:CR=1 FL=1
MKKTLLYLAVFSIFFVCNAQADEMDAMLFEPAPKITAAKKKPTAPAKTFDCPKINEMKYFYEQKCFLSEKHLYLETPTYTRPFIHFAV